MQNNRTIYNDYALTKEKKSNIENMGMTKFSEQPYFKGYCKNIYIILKDMFFKFMLF